MNRWSKAYLWFNLTLVAMFFGAIVTIFAFPMYSTAAEITVAITGGLITVMQLWEYYGAER